MQLQEGDRGQAVADLQLLLNRALHPHHPIKPDGDFGALTRRLVIQAQQSMAVQATGIADDTVVDELRRRAGTIVKSEAQTLIETAGAATWLPIAVGELEVHEIKGAAANPRIVAYHKSTTLSNKAAESDETAWCSSFVNWCVTQAGLVGTNNALARSWLGWQNGKSIDAPKLGAIAVIKHKKKPDAATGSTSGYHVAFWVGGTKQTIRLLGGNQSDSVVIKNFHLAGFTVEGYRWPVD